MAFMLMLLDDVHCIWNLLTNSVVMIVVICLSCIY